MARKLVGPTGSRRRYWSLLLCLVLAAGAATVFISGASADSVKTQTFEFDGNVAQNGAPTTFDWANFFDSSGHVNASLPPNYGKTAFVKDFNTTTSGGFDTSDSSTFTQASKDQNDVAGWTCTPANNVTDKGDIMNTYVTTFTAPDGHKMLFFALERNANTGDANVAFWFLQGGASCSGTSAFTGHHKDGDLLIVSAFTKGGVVSTITAYKWSGGASGALNPTPVAVGADCQTAAVTGNPICATSNRSGITTPWPTDSKKGVGSSLDTGEFFEGGIDLSDSSINLGNDCFNSFLADTRSSQELTATLYDFALGNLAECQSTTVTTPVDANSHANPPAASIPAAPADAKVLVSDQTVLTATGAPASFTATYDWHICGPTPTNSSQLCDATAGNVGVDLGTLPANAGGTYFSPTATVTAAGRYCFRADFSGDSSIGLPPSSDSGANECFTVAPVTPTLSTNATPTVEIGSALNDTAHLGGTAKKPGTGGPTGSDGSINPTTLGGAATGTITFKLWGPSSTQACTNLVGTSVVNVSGNGDYTAGSGSITGTLTPTQAGTYWWTATYSGDSPNTLGQTDACGGANESSNVVDANITITPLTPVNEVGNAETFTVTFTAIPAGTGTPVFSGNTNGITIGVSPTPNVTNTNTCASPTINGNVATCTVTINSSAAGTFNVSATGKVTMGGVQVTRATGDGAHGDSASAVKNYVDANIAITPLTPVNEVGNAETFTVTFTASPAATGTPAFGGGTNGITIGVSPAPGSESDTCASPTINGNVATCTVTINNSSSGTFTVNATGKVTMGGVQVTRATGDGAHGDSTSAVKNYVDAHIAITPLTPVNAVGDAETFTVTVTALPAATGSPTFADPVITESPTPDLQSGTTCDAGSIHINGNVLTCTVTINSDQTGTITVTASDQITMGGVAVTRTTGDGLHNDGPSAVKTYVDASIAITPLTPVNEIGNAETFTVTVTGTGSPTFADPVITETPTPNLQSGTACDAGSIQINGNVLTCTVTINNSFPTKITVTASDQITIGGVTVTRTTGDNAHGDSPSAVKTYVDANVSIAPDATNGITESHTFTVTVLANDGSGSGYQAVSGVNPVVTLTPAGGAAVTGLTDNCAATGTNTSGQCSVTFTSNSAGTVTGNASITFTVDGQSLTRATGDSHAGDSTDAVKTFVQGSLSWIKHDGNGALLGGATFQVCATNGTALGLTPTCVTVLDNGPNDSDPVSGQFTLSKYQSNGASPLGGLALGTYTIQETVAPAGFTLDPFMETITIDQSHLNVSALHTWVDTSGSQGCTPGFWKNHLSAWNSAGDNVWKQLIPHLTTPFGYNAALANFNNQPFFGYGSNTPPFPSPGIFGLPSGPFQGLSATLTLQGALNLGGGGFMALARHGTAALLSAGSVKYAYSIDDVLNGVRNAFISGQYNKSSQTFPDGVLTDLTNANNQPEQACPTS